MIVSGNYEIRVAFGGGTGLQQSTPLDLDLGMLQELVITQDLETTLPTLRLRVSDPTGVLTHVQPFDKSMNTVMIKFAEVGQPVEESNEFVFTVYRKMPLHGPGASGMFDLVGALETQSFLAPSYSRNNGEDTVKQFIAKVAAEILGEDAASRTEISASLDYLAPIYQANWTNSELIMDLRNRLRGKQGEGQYKIFISMLEGLAMIRVATWNELAIGPLRHVFVFGDKPYGDIPPVFNCQFYDNYMVMGGPGLKKQDYSYFDYTAGEYVQESVDLSELEALTDYHLIDGSDSQNSDSVYFGRNHAAYTDFKERATATLYDRATNLSKLWADTWGKFNLQPGDIIQIVYGLNVGNDPTEYQYSGFWMVERVVHILEKTYFTRMLLTRTGVDTSRNTTLMKTQKQRKKSSGLFSTIQPSTSMVRQK